MCWVPGHADIIGNDTADAVAKRGAAGFTGYGAVTSDQPTWPAELDHKGRAAGPEPSVKYANMIARVQEWSELKRDRKINRKRKLELKKFNSRQSSQEEPRHGYNTRHAKRARSRLNIDRNANCPT